MNNNVNVNKKQEIAPLKYNNYIALNNLHKWLNCLTLYLLIFFQISAREGGYLERNKENY